MSRPNEVSVVVPVRNCERYLGEAIGSILDQSHEPLEVLVVDDGSTDGSARVASSFPATRVRYVPQEPAGIGAARNRGVDLARGELVGFLDADDLWEREKLARQLALFAQRPELDLVFGSTLHFLSPELDAEAFRNARWSMELDRPAPGYLAGTLLARREAFARVGAFDTRYAVGEFVDWYCRAVELGLREALVPDVVMRRRLHASNHGRATRDKSDYLRVLRAHLHRRRRP